MEHGFTSLTVDLEDHEYSPENSQDSPSSGVFNDTKTTSSPSNKRSRRSLRKRVVSVPVKEIQGSHLKNEINAPPSDSWSWRKYGQKPIKGSPYPRNNNQNHHKNSTVSPPPASTPTTNQEEISNTDDQEEDSPNLSKQAIQEQEFTNQFGYDQFGWFSDLESPSNMLESLLPAGDIVCDADMGMVFSIREEEESLFADLGELPECARVFRRREVMKEEEHNRRGCGLAPWCGTKG
ncbi:hypothetical protein L1987_12506 [Smallanthus sonchifolius]|uniref:Uncharacterized protein n=1 Tax=Smallanthus sonchifolius TaxID=185202 RepID=A0ACB9JEU7_9ASTR|nr:hypothetical protein L1987_12506 [Smallanthus sonchifolius]